MNTKMKVHGVSEGKEVTLWLSMPEIAKLGIDPWRLDLMDPDPVVANIRGREIAFSKLSNVVFAYTVGDKIFVGAHDGNKGVCFYGDAVDSTENQVHLREFKVSIRPFGAHFQQYLSAAPDFTLTEPNRSALLAGLPGSGKSAFFDAMAATAGAPGGAAKSRVRPSYLPRPFSDLRVKGRRLHYSAVSGLRPRIFTGEMLETRAFQGLELPGYINQVHTIFGAWSPVVRGACLSRALLEVECKRIDFSVESGHLDAVKAFVGSKLKGAVVPELLPFHASVYARLVGDLNQASFIFKYEGRDYLVWTAENSMVEQLTIDALASESVNQVTGTRIAFQDLAQRQMRRIKSGDLSRLFDQGQPEDPFLRRVEPEHLPDGDATTSN